MFKKYKKQILIGIVVVVLLATGVAVYFYINPSKVPCLDGGSRSFVGGDGWKCYPKGTKYVPA